MSLFSIYARLSYFVKDFWFFLLLLFVATVFFLIAAHSIYKARVSERKKGLLLILAFSAFIFVVVFCGFEAYFRYQYDESDSLGFLKVSGRWFQRHVVFNNYAYRDRDFTLDKKEGVTRIGIVGDSMAFGYGIKNPEDRFSNVLEKKLLDSGRNVEVYNLGKSGYDTWNEIYEFKKVQHIKFDIIVWQYFLNDAEATHSGGTKVLLQESKQSTFIKTMSDFSYFFDYIYWRLAARYEKTFNELRQADMAAYKDPVNFERHKNEVGDFAQLLRRDNRKVIVVVLPFFKFLPDNPLSDMYPKIKRMFTDNELPLIDLYQDMKTKKAADVLVSQYDYHPNESVQGIIADRLYDKLAPMIPQKK